MDLDLKDLEMGMQAGHDSCRERWVQYYMNEVVTELRVLEPIFDELAERRGARESSSIIILRIRGMRLLVCEKAAKAGRAEAWALLAYLYLYHGADIGKRNADFMEAAENGKKCTDHGYGSLSVDVLCRSLRRGAGELHHENPLKAFRFAQKMAKKRNEDFYEVLADYYRRGYGTEPNPQMAERYLDKAAKAERKGEKEMTFTSYIDQVRAERPLVHHITNYVTVNDCANACLALGASPVMADAVDEAVVDGTLHRAVAGAEYRDAKCDEGRSDDGGRPQGECARYSGCF